MEAGPGQLRSAIYPAEPLGEFMASRQMYGLKIGILDGGKIWMDLSVEDTFAVYDPKKSEIIASGPRFSLGAGFPRRPKEFLCTLRRSLVCIEFVQNTLSLMGLDCKRLLSLKLGSRPGRESHAVFVLPKTNELILLYSSDRTINYVQVSLQKRKVIRRFSGVIPQILLGDQVPEEQFNQNRPGLIDSTSQLTLLEVSERKVVFYLKQIMTHLETSTYLVTLDLSTGRLRSLVNPLEKQQFGFVCGSLNLGPLFCSHRVPIVRSNARLANNVSKFSAEAFTVCRLGDTGAVVVGTVGSRQLVDTASQEKAEEYYWTQNLVSKYTMVAEKDGSATFIRAIVPSKVQRYRLMAPQISESVGTGESHWFEIIRTELLPIEKSSTKFVLVATRIQIYGIPSLQPGQNQPNHLTMLKSTALDREQISSLLACESDPVLQPAVFGRSLVLLSGLSKPSGPLTNTLTAASTSREDAEASSDDCDDDGDVHIPPNSASVLLTAGKTAFHTSWGAASLRRAFKEPVHGFEVGPSTVFAYSLARGFCFLTF